MRSHLALILVLGAATTAVEAQTRAFHKVVTPCNAPAPTNSLRPALTSPPVAKADANGVFALEFEWAGSGNGWQFETTHPGYTGNGYMIWKGGNLWSTPGRGVITFKIDVDNPGRHRIAVHNRHNHSDPSLENDVWIRANGSGWSKLYSNDGRNSKVWNWHTRKDPGHGYVEYVFQEGINEIEFSGRSQNFMIDRIHVFPPGVRAEDTSIRTNRQSMRPIIGTEYRVRVDDPNNEAGLTPGSTSVALMIAHRAPANDPCGTLIPGLGMNGGPGEFLLNLNPVPVVIGRGLTWEGPGKPVFCPIDIPNRPSIVGKFVYIQAVMYDGNQTVLTNRGNLFVGDV